MYRTGFRPLLEDPFFRGFPSFMGVTPMLQLQREMNRLFEGSRTEAGSDFPAVDVFANEERAVVRAELADIKSDALDISVTGDTLTLKGERTEPPLSEGERYLRRERGIGHFSRVIQLPFPVESAAVTAEYKNGIVTITLPRAQADKPKKITIR